MRISLLKRIAIGCIAVLLLVVGYYWMQRTPATSPSPISVTDTSVTDTATLAMAPDTSAINTASTVKALVKRTPPVAPTAKSRATTNRPVPASEEPSATRAVAKAVEEPVPPPCDQLVMRNGDLIDAKILEVGVNEIRYKRCNRDDGPDYVVSKSNALSIRFANGDIERFTGR